MKFITSLSLHRIERQQYCLETWKQHGDITAVQTESDIPILEKAFPYVSFKTTTLTGEVPYGYPNRVRIKALTDVGPGLLINSDIKLTDQPKIFTKKFTPQKNQFIVGIRQDFDGPGKPKTLNRYGIDAFYITQQIIDTLPDYGFVIGVSVWDYWMVWHAITQRMQIVPILDGLLHLRHEVNWGDHDTNIGYSIMQKHYGVGRNVMDLVIPRITNRDGYKA